jgi:hypothetical protein
VRLSSLGCDSLAEFAPAFLAAKERRVIGAFDRDTGVGVSVVSILCAVYAVEGVEEIFRVGQTKARVLRSDLLATRLFHCVWEFVLG